MAVSSVIRIAVVGAMAAALGLAGCGRKGGLDPPPLTSVADPNAVAQGPPGPEVAAERSAAVPAPPRDSPIDWLIE